MPELRDSWRGLIIVESLRASALPEGFPGAVLDEQRHSLDESTPVRILEVAVPDHRVIDAVSLLEKVLLEGGWYAHFVRDDEMIVVYPGEHADLTRGDAEALALAREMGARHGLPHHQMRFDEMFDVDHPDLG